MLKQYFDIYKSFWRHYFDVRSRTPCGRFWGALWWNLVVYLLIFGYILAYRQKTGAIFGIFVLVVYIVPDITPMITMLVRRFHDVGISGWWLLLTILLPLVLLIFHVGFANIVAWLCSIAMLIITLLPKDAISSKY